MKEKSNKDKIIKQNFPYSSPRFELGLDLVKSCSTIELRRFKGYRIPPPIRIFIFIKVLIGFPMFFKAFSFVFTLFYPG